MAEDDRYLQYLCRRQAALASQPGVREALLEMAEEYRISADFKEQKNAPKPQRTSDSKE
jgi:hypothetical protein